MPRATAQEIALGFALQHYPSFTKYGLQPAIGPEEPSPYPGGYVFEWRQYVDGVIGPNYVKVTTDGMGVMAIYSARDVPVVAPTRPLVSREQAVAIAQRELEGVSRDARTTLDIAPEITGRQVLRWTIGLARGQQDNSPARAEVVVDARSGEVLSVLIWT